MKRKTVECKKKKKVPVGTEQHLVKFSRIPVRCQKEHTHRTRHQNPVLHGVDMDR